MAEPVKASHPQSNAQERSTKPQRPTMSGFVLVKLRRPSVNVGGKDHGHREQVHDESERPQLASGNSLLPMNRQTEHGYKETDSRRSFR
ncbi:hypothetical protein CEP54_015961 [Fusarium duplospermum]|uniref:Uncharacterized protein n=1 Tax=Fusarium duplospermum TaxID=1325734 RepID=A0A428NJJ1_9HYPO|nr:hypothetical protein CEP54_015961 [Fusarium duplospermum]